MSTEQKCEAILRRMLEVANAGDTVSIYADWGDYTATIKVGQSHTHVGCPETPEQGGTWEHFVDQLYNSLHGGPGLSRA